MRKPSSTIVYVLCLGLLSIFLKMFTGHALAQGNPNSSPALALEEADGSISSNQIRLLFSTPVLEQSATNPASYIVTNLLGSTLSVTNVQLLNPTNVLLTTSAPRLYGNNYLVIAQGVQDIFANKISSNNVAPVSTILTLLDDLSFWYSYNPIVLYGDNPDLGTAWRQPNYDPYAQFDTIWWDNGFEPGAFWYGTTNFPAPVGAPLSQSDVPIIYFRTQVYFPGSPLGSSCSLMHLVQDGAVFFLNGAEASRFNLPTGPISWNTLASSRATPVWRGLDAFPALRLGTNTVCAELHTFQTYFTNTVFALRLQAKIKSFPSGPVAITRQPASQSVQEGQDVTFSFDGAGARTFQWYKDGTFIPGATNATLTLKSVPFTLKGSQYRVAALNPVNFVYSSNATLTVLADTNPPSLLTAYITGSNSIEVTYSEPVAPISATNVANYAITNFGSGLSIYVVSAMLTTPTNVLLQVSPGAGSNFYLLAKNIQDLSTLHNISALSRVLVGLKLHFPFDSQWSYNQSGVDLGTAWKMPTYDDSSWPLGLGLFYNENAVLPAPKNTPLNLQTNSIFIRTYYFRKSFTLPFGLTANATFNHIIDDGAVFYGNGSEINRFNMPSSIISYTNWATVRVGAAELHGPYNATLPLLGGNNVLAAEVHQSGPNSGDVCFGSDIWLTAPSGDQPIVVVDKFTRISFSRTNNLLELWWDSSSAKLQRASSLQGTNTLWQTVISGTNRYSVSPANQAGFYQLLFE